MSAGRYRSRTSNPLDRLTPEARAEVYLHRLSAQVNRACTHWLNANGIKEETFPGEYPSQTVQGPQEASSQRETDTGDSTSPARPECSPLSTNYRVKFLLHVNAAPRANPL